MERTEQNNIIVPMPRIGDKAPDFKAVTTQGEINFPKQYEGSSSWSSLRNVKVSRNVLCEHHFWKLARSSPNEQ